MASDRVDTKTVPVQSDECIEEQRAELVMNLGKPKKDTLTGLEWQSDALCALSVAGMPRMLSWSLFLWERQATIDIVLFFHSM